MHMTDAPSMTPNQQDVSSSPLLELGMQELEAMEAPGFYTGFQDGLQFTLSVASAVSIATGAT